MDDLSFFLVKQRRWFVFCWGIAAFATFLIAPSDTVLNKIKLLLYFPLFPLGLSTMIGLKAGGTGGTAYCVGGVVGWLLYLTITIGALGTQKRQRFFVLYGILCLMLLLNSVGCHRGFEEWRGWCH